MSVLSFDEALEMLLSRARKVKGTDRVPLTEAVGRILSESVKSTVDVPPLDNSGMDGYAVRCVDLPAPGATLRVAQRIPAGSVGYPLEPGTAARIFTGAPVPPGADAVVMQEDCSVGPDGQVAINLLPEPGQHIRRKGEDIGDGADVLAPGLVLTPAAIGMAASVGIAQLPVFRRLSVGIVSTGSELVSPGQAIGTGQIYNSNRYQLVAIFKNLGCEVTDYEPLPDDFEATRRLLRKAGALHDLVITSGGVSVGEEDHVKPAVEAEGELSLWNVAVKPGKPLAFGRVGNADFVGLPGNPVSVFVTFHMLVRPFVRKCQGAARVLPETRQMVAGFDWTKPGNRREFLRVRLGTDGRLERFPNQSSGVLTSCLWADGLAEIPAGQKVSRGDTLSYIRFSELP